MLISLLFVISINRASSQCPDPVHPDYQAMMNLYYSTNGASWTNKTGWEGGAAGTNCDPCSGWYGVSCNGGNRISNINLVSNNLSGTINMIQFNNLVELNLNSNQISGSLPEINCPILSQLELGGNMFSGVIPEFQTPSLTSLVLSNNMLSGRCPQFNYQNLLAFSVSSNSLSGEFPDLDLPNLRLLFAHTNNFIGVLPNIQTTQDISILFQNNNFSSCIPISYESFCAGSSSVDISNNPNLNTQSWSNYCSSREGACSNSNNNCPITASFDFNLSQCNNEDLSFNIIMNDGVAPFYINLTARNVINGQNFVVVEEFNGQLGLNTFTIPIGDTNYLSDGEYDFILIASNSNGFDVIYQCSPGLVGLSTDNMIVGPCNNANCPKIGELYMQPELCNNEDFNISLFINDGNAPFHFAITAKNTTTGQEFPLVFDFNGQGGNNNFSFQSGSPTYLPDGNYQVTAVINSSNGLDVIYQCAPSLELTKEIVVKSCMNPCSHPDYVELIKIFNSTGGTNWKRNGTVSEPNSSISGWNKDCDICNWYGIRCNANNRVVCIDLDGIDNCKWDFNSGNNNMNGTIPSLSFEEVEFFNLSNNGLFGSLSGLTLPKIKSLNITDSKLNGNLTEFDFNKPALEEIRLQYNQLTGSIPDFTLPNLKVLDLGGNKLSGELPDLNTPNLEFISFGENKNISGVIPNYEFSKLHTLYLHDNMLTGNFPNLNLPNLKILSFYKNNLSGCIPTVNKQLCNTVTNGNISNNPLLSTQSWSDFCSNGSGSCNDTIVCSHPDYAELMKLYNSTGGSNWFNKGNSTDPSSLFSGWGRDCNFCNWYGVTCDSNGNVIKLELFSNNLSGTMSDLNPLSNLEILGLGGNNIEGEIPYLKLPKLKGLYLAGNKLKGNLSSYELPNIEFIIINENKLTGQLPNFSYPKLKAMILSRNQLSGNLPDLKMPELEFLGLGFNNFSGNLPDFSLPVIKNLGLNDNSLSGCIPISYNDFCSQNIDVSLINNKDLTNDNWGDFCNNNYGACCFQPILSNYETVAKIHEVNKINIKQLGLIPDSANYKIIDIRKGNLSSSSKVHQHEYSFSFSKHFFGKIEVDIEVCGSSCNLCDTLTVFISDDYLPNIHPTNAFTPNGGTNQTLRFNDDANIPLSELFIYNRWGDRIYYAKDYTNDWDADGYPGGVYYYVLQVKDIVLRSSLTIIK